MINLEKHYKKGISYSAYLNEIKEIIQDNLDVLKKEFYPLNLKRMERIEKQNKDINTFEEESTSFQEQKLLVISEGWCGDAAQILPYVHLFAKGNNIKLKIVYRDENPELMNQFLTNGGKAIPVIIALNENGDYINHFAPRPREAQELMLELKAKGIEKSEINLNLQKWYNENKGKGVVRDLRDMFLSVPY